MKKIILPAIILSLLFGTAVFAQEVELPNPGLTPDSPFYFLKSWKESIQTFFIFGAENKAKQFLHLAEVRLAEYQKMIEKGKTEIAEKTIEKYERQLNHALEKTEEAKEKGKDVKKLKETISEKIIKHQEVLIEVLNKVPEEAKKGIENAIEMSQKGFKNAIEAVTGEKKEELQRKAEEVTIKIKTTDWKTYKNEKYGYSFKYPLDCFYGPMPVYCKQKPPEERPSECLCFLDGENPDEVFLQAYPGEKDRYGDLVLATFSVSHYMTQYFNPPFGTDLVSWLKEKFSNLYEDIPDKPNAEIDRTPAVKFYTPRSPQAFSGETIYFIKNDKLFAISMIDVDSESNRKLYNQIISTFKFIELERAGEEAPKIEEVPKIEEKPAAPNTPMMLDIDVSTTAGKPYTIGWKAISEATNYILERDTNSSFSNPVIVSSRTLNRFSETLSPSVSTRYYFRVKACNKYGCSSWSKITELWVEVLTAPVVPAVPEAPVLLDPGDFVRPQEESKALKDEGLWSDPGRYKISWQIVKGVRGYVLQEDTSLSFNKTRALLNVTDGPRSYQEIGIPIVSSPTVFYYRIKAVNDYGESPWSNVVDIEVLPPLPSITINTPNGGEMLKRGETVRIFWDSNGVDAVQIKIRNAETGREFIITEFTASVPSYYDWIIPSDLVLGDKYEIQIIDFNNFQVFDWSNKYFRIVSQSTPPKTITLTSPNGGEIWRTGDTYRITWISVEVEFVKISILYPNTSGGISLDRITPDPISLSIPAAQGYYDWTIPTDIRWLPREGGDNRGDNYKIRINDASTDPVLDESDNFFNILNP